MDVIPIPGVDDAARGTKKTIDVAVVGGALVTALPTAAGTDRSLTIGTTSLQLMPANTARRRFYVKNDTATDVWINPGAAAVATAGGGNIKVPANGGYFELGFSTSAWQIIAAAAGATITAREF